jgi:sialate O-acetylesterase
MIALSAAAFVFAQQAQTLPFVSPTFSDHMVLQRDRENTIWGWTTPGATVTVKVEGNQGRGVANSAGKWLVHFKPPKVGGPYTVDIDGPQHAELADVLVGDVWVCSGQSNMEFGLGNIPAAADEVASTNDSNLRLYTVPHDTAYSPQPIANGHWVVTNPQSLMATVPGNWNGFSAVAFYFGKMLRQNLNVPIGLVQTCWGGTIAEAWTSEAGLRPLKDFDSLLDFVVKQRTVTPVSYQQILSDWYKENDPGVDAGFASPDFDDSSWKSETMPRPFEETGLNTFDGIVWYRRTFDLDAVPSVAATLHLGAIDDADVTFINGVRVGGMNEWNDDRTYTISPNLLKAGKNSIAVRVLDTRGAGGFSSKSTNFGLTLSDGKTVDLSGDWKEKVGPELSKMKPFPDDPNGNPNIPTVLSNAMIEPLTPLAIKGGIWYQGEANAGRGEQYRRLLPALITDWRKRFHNNFPFFIVQLANFQTRHDQPVDDAWAELREAQAFTAMTLPHTGLALAIDIGEHNDIHPKNKAEVGRRLALAALHDVYGQSPEYSGPVARSVRSEGGKLIVDFDHADGLASSGGAVAGFAIAGEDMKFVWADAQIEGRRVVLSAPMTPSPKFVRYGWDMDPLVTLVNGAGLPAVPFRSDGPVPLNGRGH